MTKPFHSRRQPSRSIPAPGRRKPKRSRLWLTVAPLYVFTLLFVAGPLVYMVILSFLQRAEVWGVVNTFTFENYLKILNPVYAQTFLESLRLAFATTALTLAIGYPFGYFMAKLPAKRKKLMMLLVVIPFWTSALMRMYGWIIIFQSNGLLDKLLMGLGITEDPLRLLYSYPAVLTGMVYSLLPFMILAIYSSVEKMDWSYIEAARDLGATRARAFLTVTLKLTLPGILSGIILVFIPSMGLFFIADILGGGKVMLVGNLIRDQLMTTRDWPFAAALAVIAAAYLILVFRLRGRSRFCEKNARAISNIFSGLAVIARVRNKWAFVLYTIGIWVMYLLMCYFMFLAVPPLSHLGLMDALVISGVGNIASVIPVPGGIGAYHYLVSLCLESLYGVQWETGILYATLNHELHAILIIVYGCLSYLHLTLKRKNS